MNKYKALINKQEFAFENYSIVPIRFEDRMDILKWRNEQIYHLRQEKPLTENDQNNYFVDSPNESHMKSIIDCNDILYLLEKIFVYKKDLAKKIKKNFLISPCSNIFYDYRDLKKMGLPINCQIDDSIIRIYENFSILKKMN